MAETYLINERVDKTTVCQGFLFNWVPFISSATTLHNIQPMPLDTAVVALWNRSTNKKITIESLMVFNEDMNGLSTVGSAEIGNLQLQKSTVVSTISDTLLISAVPLDSNNAAPNSNIKCGIYGDIPTSGQTILKRISVTPDNPQNTQNNNASSCVLSYMQNRGGVQDSFSSISFFNDINAAATGYVIRAGEALILTCPRTQSSLPIFVTLIVKNIANNNTYIYSSSSSLQTGCAVLSFVNNIGSGETYEVLSLTVDATFRRIASASTSVLDNISPATVYYVVPISNIYTNTGNSIVPIPLDSANTNYSSVIDILENVLVDYSNFSSYMLQPPAYMLLTGNSYTSRLLDVGNLSNNLNRLYTKDETAPIVIYPGEGIAVLAANSSLFAEDRLHLLYTVEDYIPSTGGVYSHAYIS